jgi:HSP20 family molecular chaperone IbpA
MFTTNSLALRQPSEEMWDNWFSHHSNMFDKVFPSKTLGTTSSFNYRVRSEEQETHIEIELPGVEPSDVKVLIEGRSLNVKTSKGSVYLTIGQRLVPDEAKANLRHGLLTVSIPKRDAKIVEVNVTEI